MAIAPLSYIMDSLCTSNVAPLLHRDFHRSLQGKGGGKSGGKSLWFLCRERYAGRVDCLGRGSNARWRRIG